MGLNAIIVHLLSFCFKFEFDFLCFVMTPGLSKDIQSHV